MSFENKSLSILGSLIVVDSSGKKVGRIKDAIINTKSLQLNGFVVFGSFLEEKMEDLGIIKDFDPFITSKNIISITENKIVLNQLKKELPNARSDNFVGEDEILFSSLKGFVVKEENRTGLGIFCDLIFDKDNLISFQLGGQQFNKFLKQNNFSMNLNYIVPSSKISILENSITLDLSINELERDLKTNMTNIIRDLMLDASKDGKITQEEKDLINTVDVNLPTYYQALDKALEDGVITKEEEELLDNIKEKIIYEMHKIASSDKKMTIDEKDLVDRFASYIVNKRTEFFWSVFGGYGAERTN
ncbi:MAG: hypothetical protein ACXAC7_16490 [Candidatus Hodarchaeales archaeon]